MAENTECSNVNCQIKEMCDRYTEIEYLYKFKMKLNNVVESKEDCEYFIAK